MLCDTCEITLGNSRQPEGIHQENFKSLERAANAKEPCYICDKLFRICQETCYAKVESMSDRPDRPYFTRYSLPVSSNNRIAAGKVNFYVPLRIISDVIEMKEVTFQLNEMESAAEFSQDLPIGKPSFHNYPRVTFSRHMEAQVKRWLGNCLNHHSSCKETSASSPGQYMPSRLLYLGERNDSEVRLWIPERPLKRELCHSYMTLSHRWDDEDSEDPEIRGRQHKLTWDNIGELCRGIRKDLLPNTWQDAIFVARSIGARFLWIDSLCIIQEKSPHKDFYQETGQMADIYGNSLCNITAIGSSTSKDGCMYQRHPNTVRPCRITVLRGNEQKDYYLIPCSLWADEVDHRPLQARGWVFQELMLAPRILHLSRRQIYWQCHQLKACEVFPGGIPSYVSNKDVPPLPKLMQDMGSHSNVAAAQSAWEKILVTYTSLELSEPGDKLNALLGVIRRLEVVFSDRCVAGLWYNYLPQQLLWRSPTDISSNIMAERGRPKYRAPTWSWASTDEQAQSGYFQMDNSTIHAEMTAISLNGNSITPAMKRPYGVSRGITAGVISILSYLMTAELCITVFESGNRDTKLIINEQEISMTTEDMSIDVAENFNGSHVLDYKLGGKKYRSRARLKLFCLVISERQSQGVDSKGVECLLLRQAGPKSYWVFERYGYAKISGYRIQGRIPVNWQKIKNAEWFPPFESREQFGRYKIDII